MKKLYFSLLVALLFALPSIANNVIAKGYVTFSNGAPAVNYPVHIQTDSFTTAAGCMQYHQVFTNANGYYVDTLNCSGAIVKVRIMVQNCSGGYLVENPQVNTATNMVERNFTLNCNPAIGCHANFNINIQQFTGVFSSTSTPAPGSTITSYHWFFGDGSTATGQTATHIYTTAGTYTVKLIIESSNSCRDSITKTITIIPVAGTCHANFVDSMFNGNKFYFLSGNSTATTGDSIVQRIWSFGDGTGSSGNHVNVDHIYQTSGVYNVCLKIVSSHGCIDSICKTITVVAPTLSCVSNFSYQVNGRTVSFNSSASHGVNTTDSIITRLWYFGDGSQSNTNNVSPTHTYTSPGTYQVCLKITTASGCQKTECKTITVYDSSCHANFSYNVTPGGAVQFTNTSNSLGTAAQYQWTFGNIGSSGVTNPIYSFPAPGTYNVCLKMYSATGCRDSICKTIPVTAPANTGCQSKFTYENLPYTTPSARVVKFNSTTSTTTAGDSIISRKWQFGDGTTVTNNNAITTHVYALPGTYTVCLTIRTAQNCEKTECKIVVVTSANSACVPHFVWQRTAPKQISFNSSMSWVPVNDSIVQRTWNFGDATPLLTGNVVSPVHNYLNFGNYTVSLRIKTVQNCEHTFTVPVMLHDSLNTPPTTEPVKIISLFPNPASAQTQAVVWSQNNNVQAEIAIYDIYGSKKWSLNTVLLQGNNIHVLPLAFLVTGPYYFRVTTTYGVKSRIFFKQ